MILLPPLLAFASNRCPRVSGGDPSLQLRAEAGGRDLLEEARLIYSDAADQYLQYRHRVRGAEKRTTH